MVAWIFVDHQILGPIHLIIVPPIGVERDVDRVFFLCYQTCDAFKRKPRHDLKPYALLKAATEVVGVWPKDHEEVREPRQHRAEVSTGAVFFPQVLDAFAAPPADLHRPQELVGPESGGIDDNVNWIFSVAFHLDPVWFDPPNRVSDQGDIST